MMKSILIPIAIYVILSVLFNWQSLQVLSDIEHNSMFMVIENTPIFLDNYKRVLIGDDSWDPILSVPSLGFDFLSYRNIFWLIGNVFGATVTQIVVFHNLVVQTVAFAGCFFLVRYYLQSYSRLSNPKHVIIAAFMAGLVYGMNPSYMIGDASWLSIQFAFSIFPWIILCINKVLLDKRWYYAFISALLMAINIDEHFLWLGYPLFLLLYASFLFLWSAHKNKISPGLVTGATITLVTFVGLVSHRLAYRMGVYDEAQAPLTRLALDVPWSSGYVTNMLRAMSYPDLARIYDPSISNNSIFDFLNSMVPLTILIPAMAILALFLYRKNAVVYFYSLLLSISILPFFLNSPFKDIHYWLFFNTAVGQIFRTWRIPDAYVALSLSILISFVILRILQSYGKKSGGSESFKAGTSRFNFVRLPSVQVIGIVMICMILISSYSWPLFTGNLNEQRPRQVVKIPAEYFNTYSFLASQDSDSRVLYVPEFSNSYSPDSRFKSFWSPVVGTIPEFLINPSPMPTLDISKNTHFYDFSVSPFYHSLLRKGELETLSHVLASNNIQYLVIHNDIPELESRMNQILAWLNKSSYFRPVFVNNFMYVFENQMSGSEVSVHNQMTLADGGNRLLKKMKDAGMNISNNFIFLDQQRSIRLPDNAIIVTDKSYEQLRHDISFAMHGDSYANIYFLYDYVFEHNPRSKWSRGSYSDTHQNVWHPYVNYPDYSWDYDYGRGVVLTNNSQDKITIKVNIPESREYVVAIRYFSNENGGTIKIDLNEDEVLIDTKNSYNGFYWTDFRTFLNEGTYTVDIHNVNGFNALSLISFVPFEEYERQRSEADSYLSSKQIVQIEDDNSVSAINRWQNLIQNPSFEGEVTGWTMDENAKASFLMTLDDSERLSGESSLRITSNATEGWSWIRSDWIPVNEGDEFVLMSNMKIENARNSHLVLEAYNATADRRYQLAQVPRNQSGSFDWRFFDEDEKTNLSSFTIPKNTTRIRIVLNGGFPLDSRYEGITWFDDIALYRKIDSSLLEALPQNVNATILSVSKSNPQSLRVNVDAQSPFLLSFSEMYNPAWVAKINGEKIESIPLNSITNGFWITDTGLNEITIEFNATWYDSVRIVPILTILVWLGIIEKVRIWKGIQILAGISLKKEEFLRLRSIKPALNWMYCRLRIWKGIQILAGISLKKEEVLSIEYYASDRKVELLEEFLRLRSIKPALNWMYHHLSDILIFISVILLLKSGAELEYENPYSGAIFASYALYLFVASQLYNLTMSIITRIKNISENRHT